MRTTRWVWRWRSNPLRISMDRIEAWVGLLVAAGLVVSVPVAGLATTWALAGPQSRIARQQAHERHPTAAVLVRAAPGKPADAGALGPGSVKVQVRWTGPDGTARTGRTAVTAGQPAGTKIVVWTDTRGQLTGVPMSAAQALSRA
ncbi:Rv1733c family protein [Streptomyces maremycinicus]|uniref:Rv1733c family protein n=1 Tax=Streptomyces maremycinicus TaxID=1679753 RepID=UPI000B1A25E4|nr:hypothetical protein [Streptomyces sp. NBRC 110468]